MSECNAQRRFNYGLCARADNNAVGSFDERSCPLFAFAGISGFGLALSEQATKSLGILVNIRREASDGVYDIAGGSLPARRINPVTVYIGSLALHKVPTDFLSGVNAAAPNLLGHDALRPFRLTFDPLNRLIEFAPEYEKHCALNPQPSNSHVR